MFPPSGPGHGPNSGIYTRFLSVMTFMMHTFSEHLTFIKRVYMPSYCGGGQGHVLSMGISIHDEPTRLKQSKKLPFKAQLD